MPKIKKKLATYLAETHELIPVDIQQDMLINGHRGYLAMSEKELTDIFDKRLEETIKDRDDYANDEYHQANWRFKDLLEQKEQAVQKATQMMDELFEEVFL